MKTIQFVPKSADVSFFQAEFSSVNKKLFSGAKKLTDQIFSSIKNRNLSQVVHHIPSSQTIKEKANKAS